MSSPSGVENVDEPKVEDRNGQDPSSEGAGDGKDPEPNWQGKYDGQLQVNRDLETKLNNLRSGLASALGLDGPKKESAEQMIAGLSEQMAQVQREALVYRVVTDPKHQITDEADLALIKAAKDEDTMRKLAARLSKPADPDDGKPARRAPRVDPNRNRSGDDNSKPGDAGRAEAARRFPQKQQQNQ